MNIMPFVQKGFTLLEVIVAFAILSIVTVTSIGIATQNSIRADKFKKQLSAIEVAENALAEINGMLLFEKPQNTVRYQGKLDNGFYWRSTINIYPIHAEHSEPNIVLPLWKTDLKVFHKDHKIALVNLETILPGK